MNFLSLIFRFQGDNTDFKSKVKDSERSVHGMKGTVDGLAGSISSAFAKAGAAVAAAGLSFEGLKSAIGGAIEEAKNFRKLQTETGLPIDQIQFYAKAAKRANEETGLIVTTFEKFKIAQAEALAKGAESDPAKNLAKLGFSFEQLKNSVPGDLFAQFMDGLSKEILTADQAAAGHEILGRSFHALAAVAEELGRAKKKAIFGADEIAGIQSFARAFEGAGGRIKMIAGQTLYGLELIRRTLAEKGLANSKGQFALFENAAGTMVELGAEGKKREDQVKAAERAQLEENKRAAEFQQRQEAAKAHMAQMDEAQKDEEKAAETNEKARVAELTDEERINELLKQRAALKSHVDFMAQNPDRALNGETAQTDAEIKRKLAEVNLEIATIAKKGDKPLEPRERDSLAKSGLFVGGRRDPLIDINQQSLNRLGEIKSVLDEIKNRPAKSIVD